MSQNKPIISRDISEIVSLLKSGNLSVCVIGIGRIGLPTALSFANANLTTYGVDINENLEDNYIKLDDEVKII